MERHRDAQVGERAIARTIDPAVDGQRSPN
jgi:hypothetical protein